MMSVQRKILFGIATVAVTTVMFMRTPQAPDLQEKSQIGADISLNSKVGQSNAIQTEKFPVQPRPMTQQHSPGENWPPLSERETESIQVLFETLQKFSKQGASPENFVQTLESLGLSPVIADDDNGETGRHTMIRADQAMEGTRYIHAQFQEDEGHQPFAQHLSFELRPGPDSWGKAIAVAQTVFGLNEPSGVQRSDFVEWHRGGRTLWIKKIGESDLSADHFNARTKADVGAVMVALEIDPHAHER